MIPVKYQEPKRNAIICDLDGTLADCEWRRRLYLQGDKKNFDEFNANCGLDEAYFWCQELVTGMHAVGYEPIFVTGRSDDNRTTTLDWLRRRFPLIKNPMLYMRKAGNYEPDDLIKEGIYREHIEPLFNILFVVDDRNSVVDMWRDIGLTCLQCAEGDF